jgi:hypothetical protein
MGGWRGGEKGRVRVWGCLQSNKYYGMWYNNSAFFEDYYVFLFFKGLAQASAWVDAYGPLLIYFKVLWIITVYGSQRGSQRVSTWINHVK